MTILNACTKKKVETYWMHLVYTVLFLKNSFLLIHALNEIMITPPKKSHFTKEVHSITILLRWVKSFAIFWYVVVFSVYIMWLKQLKLWCVLSVVGSIVVVSASTRCTLFSFVCDLKVALMNMKYGLIQEVRLYQFELCHNVTKATKNICCGNSEGAVTRLIIKFLSDCKKLDDQWRSVKPKTVGSEVVFHAIKANSESSTKRVSGELSISQFKVARHIHNLGKNTRGCRIVFHVLTKYCKTIDSS